MRIPTPMLAASAATIARNNEPAAANPRRYRLISVVAQASVYYRTIKTDTEAFRATTKEAAMAYLEVARKAEA